MRTSIDESHLPTSDQEVFFSDPDKDELINISGPDDTEENIQLPDFPHINQDIISKFEYTIDNYSCKEIKNHQFSEGILLFDILTVNSTTITILFLVLK